MFQLCSLMEKGSWTLERDEDLTAPYAYSGPTWVAFDDSVSTAIKVNSLICSLCSMYVLKGRYLVE